MVPTKETTKSTLNEEGGSPKPFHYTTVGLTPARDEIFLDLYCYENMPSDSEEDEGYETDHDEEINFINTRKRTAQKTHHERILTLNRTSKSVDVRYHPYTKQKE